MLAIPTIWSAAADIRAQGKFHIDAGSQMGSVNGDYTLEINHAKAQISLIPSGGWRAVPNSLLTKFMLSDKSMFCTWQKSYKYTQEIDLHSFQSSSCWERI